MHARRLRRNGDPLARKKPANGEALAFYVNQVVPYDGDECLVWPFTRDKQGYGKLMVDGKNKTVSRLVCEAANGPPPTLRHDAAHSCGRGKFGCVAKRHMRWATRKENVADMIAHGTMSRGSQRRIAKLHEADVLEIVSRRGKVRTSVLAKQYGVKNATICDIMSGRNWGWLTGAGSPDTGMSSGGLY